ncbi:hypothetical protein LXL04_025729 [Taraxacum kok-saghyz]
MYPLVKCIRCWPKEERRDELNAALLRVQYPTPDDASRGTRGRGAVCGRWRRRSSCHGGRVFDNGYPYRDQSLTHGILHNPECHVSPLGVLTEQNFDSTVIKFKYVELANFDVASDAFSTFKSPITTISSPISLNNRKFWFASFLIRWATLDVRNKNLKSSSPSPFFVSRSLDIMLDPWRSRWKDVLFVTVLTDRVQLITFRVQLITLRLRSCA